MRLLPGAHASGRREGTDPLYPRLNGTALTFSLPRYEQPCWSITIVCKLTSVQFCKDRDVRFYLTPVDLRGGATLTTHLSGNLQRATHDHTGSTVPSGRCRTERWKPTYSLRCAFVVLGLPPGDQLQRTLLKALCTRIRSTAGADNVLSFVRS